MTPLETPATTTHQCANPTIMSHLQEWKIAEPDGLLIFSILESYAAKTKCYFSPPVNVDDIQTEAHVHSRVLGRKNTKSNLQQCDKLLLARIISNVII